MGCGRSRHRSPTKYQEGQGEGEGERGKKRRRKKKAAKGGAKADTGAGTSNAGSSSSGSDSSSSSKIKAILLSPTSRTRKRGFVGPNQQGWEPMSASSGVELDSPNPSAQEQRSSPPRRIMSPPSRHFPYFFLLNGGLLPALRQKGHLRLKRKGPLRLKRNRATESQQEFFKMLDEKIAMGRDYDSDDSF